MTQTIKERLELLKKPEYVHDLNNQKHNDFEESLDYLETKGEAHEDGFNAGVDACLPLLEEERKQSLISFQEAIEAVGLKHIEDWVKVQLEALNQTK